MADKKKELDVRKEETSLETESTRDVRIFTPKVDIVEESDRILLFADMPGVDEKHVDITLEKGILSVSGSVSPEPHKGYRLAYAEYGVGDYRRSFTISDTIDKDGIAASVRDGVLKLVLPKAEPAKPRKIAVQKE